MNRAFVKMNGLGNDFVIVDARGAPFAPAKADIARWADRHTGIGFDQLIAIEDSSLADSFMRVWNADGSSVETCGNALRCVGFQLDPAATGKPLRIDTLGGLTKAVVLKSHTKSGTVSVDMGAPRFDWQEIPLMEEMNTNRLELQIGPMGAPLYHTPAAVNMGNPHCIFFVEDVLSVDVAKSGSLIEHHMLFPKATNVEFAQILDKTTIRMRVWERGAGITKACGTGACATAVAAMRRKYTDRTVTVIMDGGPLTIHWADNDHVFMTGPVEIEFEGYLS